jgi:hypothetical protein
MANGGPPAKTAPGVPGTSLRYTRLDQNRGEGRRYQTFATSVNKGCPEVSGPQRPTFLVIPDPAGPSTIKCSG